MREKPDSDDLTELLAEWRAFKRRLLWPFRAITRAKESDNG